MSNLGRRGHDLRVVIDCFPGTTARYAADHRIVVVDVIRATTLAVTAAMSGRRCIVAASPDEAFVIRRQLGEALLAGELGGDMPSGFDMNNSPADLDARSDVELPLVMVSSSGAPLMLEGGSLEDGAEVACFRNFSAVARELTGNYDRVAIIGAGSRGEFREEDQICCAWLGGLLTDAGYVAENDETSRIIERWRDAPAAASEISNSVGYLRRSGQLRDYDFIVDHVDDVEQASSIVGNEVFAASDTVGGAEAAAG